MKNFYQSILLLLFFIAPFQGFSQRDDAKLHLGPELGLNFSFLNSKILKEELAKEGFKTNSFRLSFGGGFRAKYRLSNVLSIQSGLIYATRGGAIKNSSRTYNTGVGGQSNQTNPHVTFKLNYFEVPVVLSLNLTKLFRGDHYDSDLEFALGFTNAFNSSSKAESEDYRMNYFNVERSSSTSDLDVAKDYVYNLVVGFDYNYLTSTNYPMFTSFRWTQSLTNVYDDEISVLKTNTSSLSLSVGVYLFNK